MVAEVKAALDAAKVKNIRYEPMDQFERSWD